MSGLGSVLDWFAGGSNRYMNLVHCMNHDWFWIGLTVLLDLAVASGYVLIALHWRRNERPLADSPAKSALRDMKQIFVFCGLCGYLFIPIKMFWPAWRLYDAFVAVLAYYTWRYAANAKDLHVVYNELGRSEQLAQDLEDTRADAKRKSSFLNAIGHDLRTPLNGLLLQAELAELSLSGKDEEGCREALDEIKKCAKMSATLLNKFLEIGRLDWSQESLRWTRFPLAQFLAEVAEKCRPQAAAKGLSLGHACDEGVFLCSDRNRLERILLNLLDNAVLYTETGDVRLLGEAEGEDVVIRVVDTGIGIAPAQKDLIFDDFYQVKNRERDSTKGFGLGLPIARRLARQLGGTLGVESELGHGSRFILRLRNAADDGDSTPSGVRRRGERIAQAASSAG